MNIPDKIIVPIEFDPVTDYYALERKIPGSKFRESIHRISLEGIWRYLAETIEIEDISNFDVVFWRATKVGHTVEWRMSGQEFLNRAETHVIDKMTRYGYSDKED